MNQLILTLVFVLSSASLGDTLRLAWVNFPPFVVASKDNKKVSGRLVSKTHRVLKGAGLSVKDIILPMSRLIKMAEKNQIDLVISHPQLFKTKPFLFGKYTFQEFKLALLANQPIPKEPFEALVKNKFVGVMHGYFYFGFKGKVPKSKLVTVKSHESGLKMLNKNRLSYMLTYEGRYQKTLEELVAQKAISSKEAENFQSTPLVSNYTTMGVRANLPNAPVILDRIAKSYEKFYGPSVSLPPL